jgi:hypothetical protein
LPKNLDEVDVDEEIELVLGNRLELCKLLLLLLLLLFWSFMELEDARKIELFWLNEDGFIFMLVI